MKYIAVKVAEDQRENLLRSLRGACPHIKRSFIREETSNADEYSRSFQTAAIPTGRIMLGLVFEDEDEEVVMGIASRYHRDIEVKPYDPSVVVEFQEL